MNFRKALRALFRVIFSRLERVSAHVDPAEDISRFIFSKDYFSTEKGTIKVAAFMPKTEGVDISVYRTSSCTEEKVWWLGERYVARARRDGRSLLARADLKALGFLAQNLDIKKHPRPHPRHANVVGWPDDKPARKMKATALANMARLHIKPPL